MFYASIINLFQVLAHRGSHWTTLQTVCQTAWDQSCRIALLVQRAAQVKPPFLLTSDQLHTTFTPLFVLSTDLIMDMLNRLGVSATYSYTHTNSCFFQKLHSRQDYSRQNHYNAKCAAIYRLPLIAMFTAVCILSSTQIKGKDYTVLFISLISLFAVSSSCGVCMIAT